MRGRNIIRILLCIVALPVITMSVIVACCMTAGFFKQQIDASFEEEITEPIIESTTEIQPERIPLADLLTEYLEESHIPLDQIAYCVDDLISEERYSWRAEEDLFAASLYKLPLTMAWLDKVNRGECALESYLYYDPSYYEAGGPIGDLYAAPVYLDLETLVHAALLYSDNTAGHILFENMGGWLAYKAYIAGYSDAYQSDVWYTYYNCTNAAFMNDVLKRLYDQPHTYAMIRNDLSQALPSQYFNTYEALGIMQKYGRWDYVNNICGLSEEGHPFVMTVMSELGDDGETVMADMFEIVYAYMNEGGGSQ